MPLQISYKVLGDFNSLKTANFERRNDALSNYVWECTFSSLFRLRGNPTVLGFKRGIINRSISAWEGNMVGHHFNRNSLSNKIFFWRSSSLQINTEWATNPCFHLATEIKSLFFPRSRREKNHTHNLEHPDREKGRRRKSFIVPILFLSLFFSLPRSGKRK